MEKKLKQVMTEFQTALNELFLDALAKNTGKDIGLSYLTGIPQASISRYRSRERTASEINRNALWLAMEKSLDELYKLAHQKINLAEIPQNISILSKRQPLILQQ